tara:strand:+ start:298 stop:459 length:162 start_codon:yes stop_codon:yes gene_type:complete
MSELQELKQIKAIVDSLIESKTKKTKTVKKSSNKKAAKKKPPEMFSWEWWMTT